MYLSIYGLCMFGYTQSMNLKHMSAKSRGQSVLLLGNVQNTLQSVLLQRHMGIHWRSNKRKGNDFQSICNRISSHPIMGLESNLTRETPQGYQATTSLWTAQLCTWITLHVDARKRLWCVSFKKTCIYMETSTSSSVDCLRGATTIVAKTVALGSVHPVSHWIEMGTLCIGGQTLKTT